MKRLNATAAISLIAIMGLTVSGCTDQVVPPSDAALTSETSSPSAESVGLSNTAIPNDAEVFEKQSSTITKDNQPLKILQQVTGTGNSTFNVDSLPEGYTQLGAAIQCIGGGEWIATFDGDESRQGSSDCSLNGDAGISIDLPDSSASHTIEVQVENGTPMWVTIFADMNI